MFSVTLRLLTSISKAQEGTCNAVCLLYSSAIVTRVHQSSFNQLSLSFPIFLLEIVFGLWSARLKLITTSLLHVPLDCEFTGVLAQTWKAPKNHFVCLSLVFGLSDDLSSLLLRRLEIPMEQIHSWWALRKNCITMMNKLQLLRSCQIFSSFAQVYLHNLFQ